MLALFHRRLNNGAMDVRPEINVFELHREFSSTQHGQVLAEQVRYERYKPDAVSNERWVDLLGADVNNLAHMHLTWGLTRDMIRGLRISHPGMLDERQELLLEIGAIIHDRGEAIVTDITYSDKTAKDEALEQDVLISMVGASHDLVREAAETVVFDREGNSELGNIFNTIERVGYVRTALRAARHVHEGTAPDAEAGLRWIIADVFGNHPQELLNRAGQYMPVDSYMTAMVDEITAAFNLVRPDDFENYEPDQRPVKIAAFVDSANAWKQFLAQNGEGLIELDIYY